MPGTHVTAVLPRRSYSPLLGRLLHDRTADKIAAAVSQIPNATATIVPFDVRSRLEVLHERQLQRERAAAARAPGDGQAAPGTIPAVAGADAAPPDGATGRGTRDGTPGAPAETHGIGATDGAEELPSVLAEPPPSPLRNLLRRRRSQPAGEPAEVPADGDRAGQDNAAYNRPAPPPGVNPIGSLTKPGRATVAGRVRAVEIRPVERNSVLAAEISDATGDLTALFYGRSHIPGLICGARVRFRGAVGIRNGRPVMTNPAYELLAPGDASPPDGEQS